MHVLDLDKTGYIKPHIDSVKVSSYLLYISYLHCIAYVDAAAVKARLCLSRVSCTILLFFQFCGSTIAGLSLLSDSVMRLVKEDATDEWLDLLLPRHSLYILRSINVVNL